MRSLDLDLFNPVGIDADKARFIEALLLTCLVTDSPFNTEEDFAVNNANQLAVANFGRKPGLELMRNGKKTLLKDWAEEILEAMEPVCAILDQNSSDKPYSSALAQQRVPVQNPDRTPSARMLETMSRQQLPFARLALKTSIEHERYFKLNKLDENQARQFQELAEQSLAKQKDIESKDQLSFDEFLQQYFAQH
jgi:glutamate--cysteine ligase